MIFLTTDRQVAYYHAPKCGSRTMLGYIALADTPTLYETNPGYFKSRNDNVYGDLRGIAIKEGSHDFAPNAVPKSKSPYRICVKRDPVQRFLSGYRNRVLFHKDVKGTPGISKFIRNFREYNQNPTLKRHFKPQVSFYGTDPSIFTNIFSIENMSETKEFFEDLYKITIPDIRLQQGGNEVNIKLTTAEEDWIRNRYQADYAAGWC